MKNGTRALAVLASSALVVALAIPAAAGSGRDLSRLRGAYVFSLDGFAISEEVQPPIPLPLVTVGRYVADGRGRATVELTQNLFGCFIVRQEGRATYTVEPDGTGTVRATVANVDVEEVGGTCPVPVMVPPEGTDPSAQSVFELRFAIDRKGNQLVIGTKLLVPPILVGGEEVPIVYIVTDGEARRASSTRGGGGDDDDD